ncbi:MAG TPA: glycosyltransferase family 39 protein [Chthoniobacterales bacterium]|jgi:4-amino-4-deoxy-L-arabinose transferase-like glycosyltransferase|nr:glycosyltransferase family 39 protein [Chthoniobacterales bacterium]
MGWFVKTRCVVRVKWLLVLIVVAAFVVRLIGIDQPFIDPWSWRQSDVAAIARNYLENGFHFTKPQIDWAGNQPGYVGTEFPILPFLAALSYTVVGVQEWIGRMEGVLFFVAALPFFFGLVRRVFGEIVAVWATFFYAFAPLGIVASRAFMPDVPSLSLAIIGLYLFLRWIEDEKFSWLIFSAILISLASLIKLPTAIVGAPLLYLAIIPRKKKIEDGGSESAAPWFARWELWVFAAVVLVPSAVWYWHAYRIAERFYPYHFFGAGGFRIMSPAWYWQLVRQTVFSSLSLTLFVLAIFGAVIAPRGKFTRVFHWWLAAMFLFVVFAGYGNRHQWYQLPLVPIAAVFAGCACAWFATRTQFPRKLLTLGAVLVVASFAVSSFFCVQPFYRPAAASLRDLGLELQEATTANSLIIAATDGDPTVFYYAHRKGWHFLGDGVYDGNPRDSAQIIANLEKLRSRGATHLVFYAGTQWWLDYYEEFAENLATHATLVEQTPEFTVFKLAPPP